MKVKVMLSEAYIQSLSFFNQMNELTHWLTYGNSVAAKQL